MFYTSLRDDCKVETMEINTQLSDLQIFGEMQLIRSSVSTTDLPIEIMKKEFSNLSAANKRLRTDTEEAPERYAIYEQVLKSF